MGHGDRGRHGRGFAFDPQTYAPTYRLVYGAPGRSLAIEMAQRLGMPLSVVAAARGFLSDDQKRLQAHLDRIDAQARALDAEKTRLDRERRAFNEQKAALDRTRAALTEREDAFKKRLNEKIDERLRQARRDIDAVIDQLKERSEALLEKASLRAAGAMVNTGESGAARAEARAAIERIAERPCVTRQPSPWRTRQPARAATSSGPSPLAVGAKVAVGALGLEGTVVSISGSQVELDVRGKRMRAKAKDLRVIGGPPSGRPLTGESPRQRRPQAARGAAQRDQRHRLHGRRGGGPGRPLPRRQRWSPTSARSASSTASAPASCARASRRS